MEQDREQDHLQGKPAVLINIVDGFAVLVQMPDKLGTGRFRVLHNPYGGESAQDRHDDFRDGTRENGRQNDPERDQPADNQADDRRDPDRRVVKHVVEEQENQTRRQHEGHLIDQEGIDRDRQTGAVRQAALPEVHDLKRLAARAGRCNIIVIIAVNGGLDSR